MIEYYRILGLGTNASEKELKEAFRRLSKEYHPDTNLGSDKHIEKFRLIQNAYEKILIFIKANEYRSNRSSSNNSAFRTSNENEERKSKQTSSSRFNYYEFVNDYGLHEDDLFEETETSIQKQYSPNENIIIGDFEYRISSFLFIKEFGNQIFKARSDGYFLIIGMDVRNVSTQMISLHNYMFRIFDREGYYYEFSSSGLSNMLFLNELVIPIFGREQNPKIKSHYKLIFEVPEIDDYYIQLCGGDYQWNKNNICICKEIATVKLRSMINT